MPRVDGIDKEIHFSTLLRDVMPHSHEELVKTREAKVWHVSRGVPPKSAFDGDSKELRDLLMLLRDALVHSGSDYWETFPDGERVGPVLHDCKTWHVSWGEPEWIQCVELAWAWP